MGSGTGVRCPLAFPVRDPHSIGSGDGPKHRGLLCIWFTCFRPPVGLPAWGLQRLGLIVGVGVGQPSRSSCGVKGRHIILLVMLCYTAGGVGCAGVRAVLPFSMPRASSIAFVKANGLASSQARAIRWASSLKWSGLGRRIPRNRRNCSSFAPNSRCSWSGSD